MRLGVLYWTGAISTAPRRLLPENGVRQHIMDDANGWIIVSMKDDWNRIFPPM